ncbi:hypothetical protein DFH07DRAFT_790881 [Mycena maculata]|uniref:Uncharacterized protein n=1 Tax=Mycena maculata TaxID=230809 RepID=A0AAD7KCI4_9AGAR|nr:hypothetical protein DFH07DRAFT_790881 [Mycena maculata]
MAWASFSLCLGGLTYSIPGLRRTDTLGPQVGTAPFSNVQLVIFLLVFVESFFCAFMVYLEIRTYGRSLKPQRQNTSQAEIDPGSS